MGTGSGDGRRVGRLVCFGPAEAGADGRFDFEFDPERLELRRRGRHVDLRPQAARALKILLESEGRLVAVSELRRELWGDQQLGWRNSLHQAVADLRRRLGDDPRCPRFVATVPRLGYRFVGAREPIAPPCSSVGHLAPVQAALRRPSLAFSLGVTTAVLVPAAFLVVCTLLAG